MSSIFDILGPVMVGPSSSHTAGAVRIGLVSRILLEDEVVFADIQLHGSLRQLITVTELTAHLLQAFLVCSPMTYAFPTV